LYVDFKVLMNLFENPVNLKEGLSKANEREPWVPFKNEHPPFLFNVINI